MKLYARQISVEFLPSSNSHWLQIRRHLPQLVWSIFSETPLMVGACTVLLAKRVLSVIASVNGWLAIYNRRIFISGLSVRFGLRRDEGGRCVSDSYVSGADVPVTTSTIG
jgi:hypothetical protein